MSSTVTVEHSLEQPRPEPAKHIPYATTYSSRWALALFIVDLALFTLSAYLAHLLAQRIWHTPPFAKQLTGAIIVITLWVLMFRTLGLYHRTYAFRMKDELYYTFAALALGVAPQLVVFTIVPAISTSRMGALLSLALSIAIVGSGRAIMHGVCHLSVFTRGARSAFVGNPQRMDAAIASIDAPMECAPLRIPVDDVESTLHAPAAAPLETVPWFAQALHSGCGTIVFTEIIDPRVLPQLLDVATRYRMRIAFAPPRIKRHSFRLSLETRGNQALIFASQLNACTPTARLRKRLLDLLVGSIALVIFAPVMVVCAIAVYLDSGLPVLYRQERVGLGGRTFTIFKFRSMRSDAETATGPIWVRENDDRRTRVGAILRRLSFDELPQLFNVLRGEMSLVGPRPERPVFVERFREMLDRYDERHLVPPGITGWSHIHMRRQVNTSDIHERLEYDLRYVEEWTVWLDVSILFKTAVEFLFHRSV